MQKSTIVMIIISLFGTLVGITLSVLGFVYNSAAVAWVGGAISCWMFLWHSSAVSTAIEERSESRRRKPKYLIGLSLFSYYSGRCTCNSAGKFAKTVAKDKAKRFSQRKNAEKMAKRLQKTCANVVVAQVLEVEE